MGSDADPLDTVRRFYRALNAADLDALAAAYHPACETERLVPTDDTDERHVGRPAQRALLAGYFSELAGGFEGGARVAIRTLAAIETGWVHAEWIESIVPREGGERREFVGYTHFLIESGLIRQQRTVRHPRTERTEPPPVPSRRSYPERPVPGVGAVIWIDGRVVLVKRRFEPLAGQWSLPGGSLEVGETLQAGVAREVLEETGLEVEVGPLVEVFDRILLDEAGRVRYHFVLIDYLCFPRGGDLQAGSDVAEVALADPDALARYRLTPKAAGVIARGAALARGLSAR